MRLQWTLTRGLGVTHPPAPESSPAPGIRRGYRTQAASAIHYRRRRSTNSSTHRPPRRAESPASRDLPLPASDPLDELTCPHAVGEPWGSAVRHGEVRSLLRGFRPHRREPPQKGVRAVNAPTKRLSSRCVNERRAVRWRQLPETTVPMSPSSVLLQARLFRGGCELLAPGARRQTCSSDPCPERWRLAAGKRSRSAPDFA
jgi:hypothetical protein